MNLFNHDFLGTVTKVAPTKDGWVSIFADEKRVARVPRTAMEQIVIQPGQEWTRPLAAACELAAEAFRAKMKAIALLKVKARSRAELRERLVAAGFGADACDLAIEELAREKRLDDAALTQNITQRAEQKGLSASAAAAKLESRGLSPTAAATATGELDRATEAARNRAGRLPESLPAPTRARRLLAALARLGYEEETAREAVQRVLGFQDE
ncbi:MAG TPA: RecX family transcriptional regulator [Phycisphaerales bacterium]|nr:RecX family transcriptional regulator [Phycisphaerales bacterium]